MTKTKLYLSFFVQTFKSPSFILKTLFATLFFLLTAMVLLNIINIFSIGTSNYPLLVKMKIITILIVGAFKTVSLADILFLGIIALLFGTNVGLVAEKLKFLRKQNNLRLTFGVGIVSLIAAGCASCGLSVASLLGLGSALAFLPFHGIELYFLSIIILFVSLVYNLKIIYKACMI